MPKLLHKILVANMLVQVIWFAICIAILFALLTPLRVHLVAPYDDPCDPVPFFDCGGVAVIQEVLPPYSWLIKPYEWTKSALFSADSSTRFSSPVLLAGYIESCLFSAAFIYVLLYLVSGVRKHMFSRSKPLS